MDSEILSCLNFNRLCRVCLLESDSMFSIYSELFEDNSDEKIPRIYQILTNISSIKVQSDDGLPSMICTKCIDKAHSSYKFQQQCNKSQELLEMYVDHIKQLLKSEEPQHLHLEEFELKEQMLQNGSVTDENVAFHSKYLLINDVDLHGSINNESDVINEQDCDDLSLGEDTVDLLIKDNLQVDNLELISPKIRSFNLNLKPKESKKPANKKKASKKPPKDVHNMTYFQKEKENGSVEYECNVCQKIFKFGNSLRIHLKNHSEEKPYVCTECKKGFKLYRSLMYHIRSHSSEQPYECKECGKKYKQSGTLTAHMRIHSGLKPFLCTVCGRGFRQAPDLTYHMRTHTKEKPYMCNVCGKTMSMQCHLVQHMRSHTGERPFKCLQCGKAFPSSTRLKRHSITHTDLKPYKCVICEKSFNRSSSLRVHSKTHLSVRSHVCPVCNRTFLWAHSLRGHMTTHSKGATETPSESPSESTAVNADSNVNVNADKSNDGLTMFTDALEKVTGNKCFAIYSTESGEATESVAEGFQIYSIEATDQDGLETFTLYSAETNEHSSSTGVKLSAVSL